jgi:hypothetical protein
MEELVEELSTPSNPNSQTAQTTPVPVPQKEQPQPPKTPSVPSSAPILFHYAECTNCHNLLPISTTTEKYFMILSKDPTNAMGLGERCARCGADSWMIVKG